MTTATDQVLFRTEGAARLEGWTKKEIDDARDSWFPGWWTYEAQAVGSPAPVYRVICATPEEYLLAKSLQPSHVRADIRYAPEEEGRIRSVRELPSALQRLRSRLARTRPVFSTDSADRAFVEAERNREVLAALIADDWVGLAVLANTSVATLPTALAESLGVDINKVAAALARLVCNGLVSLVDSDFVRSDSGEMVLASIESSTGVRLRPE